MLKSYQVSLFLQKPVFPLSTVVKRYILLLVFYCMKSGHTYRTCIARKYLVPKSLAKWLPKEMY